MAKIYHTGLCPKIKSVEYYENGKTKKIEFQEERPEHFPTWPSKSEFDYTVQWLIS